MSLYKERKKWLKEKRFQEGKSSRDADPPPSSVSWPLLIYPNSSDLINLCRGTAEIGISDLGRRLAAHSHQIVLSLETLIELVAPLRHGQSNRAKMPSPVDCAT